MRAPHAVLAAGTQLGAYRIERALGAGGMGTVYLATDTRSGAAVALKTLHPELASDQVVAQRFLREAKSAMRVRHPHIVEVLEVGAHEETLFLAMELLEGENFGARIARARLSAEEAADVMLPVLDAMAVAHESDVIHRDLKPENIFLSPAGPKVLDFGLAKILDEPQGQKLTATNSLVGTPYYMAPEQAFGAQYATRASDQYALGAILYEAVTGRKPVERASVYELLQAIAHGQIEPPSSVAPDLHAGLEAVIVRAMQREPAQRHGSLRSFGGALLPFASEATRARWRDRMQIELESPPLAATFAGSAELPANVVPALPAAPPARASTARAIVLTAVGFFGVILLGGLAILLLR